MLEAVYFGTVEEKSVVAIRPKSAFRPIFKVATTRAGSGISLINETPPGPEGPEAESLCSWWRRGRVELGLKHGLAVLVDATIPCADFLSLTFHRVSCRVGPALRS